MIEKNIASLHFITHANNHSDEIAQVKSFCAAGGSWVQLRMKNADFKDFLNIAQQVKNLCDEYKAILIINDNVEIAKAINADGVHLGKNDMSVEKARDILGNNKIIGYTCNSLKDIQKAPLQMIDYIGLGPFRYTETKENLSSILGLDGYKNILAGLNVQRIPIIAIGGIRIEDVNPILNTGIYGIAVSGAINNSDNPTQMTQYFLNEINQNEYTTTANCR